MYLLQNGKKMDVNLGFDSPTFRYGDKQNNLLLVLGLVVVLMTLGVSGYLLYKYFRTQHSDKVGYRLY